MALTADGLAKLAEECGELLQVVGKKLAYYYTDEHPDRDGSLKRRLENEIADVIAVCGVVVELHGLDKAHIDGRIAGKAFRLAEWHHRNDNNEYGVDRGETQS